LEQTTMKYICSSIAVVHDLLTCAAQIQHLLATS
jgi:hypothetical protein